MISKIPDGMWVLGAFSPQGRCIVRAIFERLKHAEKEKEQWKKLEEHKNHELKIWFEAFSYDD